MVSVLRVTSDDVSSPFVAGGCSVLDLPENNQPGVLFIVNGALSTVSDNVFVATVFIKGVAE
eukprot:COSAG02_NODE_2431_length_8875_cov_9.810164_4_plen_62_part_00